MAEPSRHLATDYNVWPWCGNNDAFDRINETSGWAPQCDWSATQYVCTQACCVSTWQNTSDATPGAPTAGSTTYAWWPPSADFWDAGNEEGLPGPFFTLRPDDSVYKPDAAAAQMPFQLYQSTVGRPLTFFETGELNPLGGGRAEADCLYGVNHATGYCFLTNQSLPYDEQLRQLGDVGAPLSDPSQPFDAESNPYLCSCDGCTPHEDFGHLSIVGVLSTIVCTYAGFALLAVAVGWNANILGKLRKIGDKWKKLRAAHRRPAAPAAPYTEYSAPLASTA